MAVIRRSLPFPVAITAGPDAGQAWSCLFVCTSNMTWVQFWVVTKIWVFVTFVFVAIVVTVTRSIPIPPSGPVLDDQHLMIHLYPDEDQQGAFHDWDRADCSSLELFVIDDVVQKKSCSTNNQEDDCHKMKDKPRED